MSIIKAIFFDLDGTLVNTHKANHAAYYEAILAVTGVQSDIILRQYIADGLSSSEFIPYIVAGATEQQVIDINTTKRRVYPDYLHLTERNEGLASLLRHFSPTMTIGLVTTAKKANARAVLEAHDLLDCFDFCIFGDDVSDMKPNPEAYLKALELAKVRADEAIAFEDSDKGRSAAIAAGISVINVEEFVL